MRFPPGQPVSLYFEDGTEIHTKPFYFKGKSTGRFDMEFIADDGTRIQPVDDSEDCFEIRASGRRLFLQPP